MQVFLGNEPTGRSIVVVGVDFSEPSQRALGVARSIAVTAPKPEIHVLHVFPGLQTLGLSASAVGADGLALEPVQQARTLLNRAATDLLGDAHRVTAHLRFGDPAREIAQLAADVNADLVIVGTQGRSGIERALLGSTAEAVVRRAPCTVLTVRAKPEHTWLEIDPPCPDCLTVQRQTLAASLWCARHTEHHARAHLHYTVPNPYAMGSQSFREPS